MNSISDLNTHLEEILLYLPRLSSKRLEHILIEDLKTRNMKKYEFISSIKVCDLRTYYNKDLIFSNVNLEIKKGDKVAITGPNGAGKSTFIKCFLQLNQYQGQILMDDIDLSTIENTCLRSMISYIPQESMLFDGSILDNLRAFNSKITDEEIFEKCIEFEVHSEFKSIGYDSNAINISVDQRQKISFMRAIIRDAPIIVIDELTADMSKKTEDEIIGNIINKMKDKTVIMIIHNLDLLKRYNKIIFVNNGTAEISSDIESFSKTHKEFANYIIK